MAGTNATIGSLNVLLGLNSAEFNAGLKRAQGSLGGFAKIAAGVGAAAAAALAGVGVAIGAAVTGALDNADELGKASQKVGVAVESLSRLKYAGDLADVSLDQLTTGLKKLGVGLAEAAGKGTGKAAEALHALGLSATDANGRLKASDAVLIEIAGKFAAMEDGAGKTALAVALFGKAGSDLIPLLNEGADGLAQMAAEADALGVTIDANAAAAAETFNDNLTRLKTVVGGLSTQLAGQLAPSLADVTNSLVATFTNANVLDGIGKALAVTVKVLGSVVIGLGVALGNTAKVMGAFAKAIVQIFQGDFAGAFETIKTGFGQGLKAIADGAQNIRALWGSTGGEMRRIAPDVSDGIAAPLVQAGDKAKKAAKTIDKAAQDAARAQADAAKVVQGLRHDLDTLNLTPEEQKDLEARYRIALLIADGYAKEAAEAHALLLELQDLRAFSKADLAAAPEANPGKLEPALNPQNIREGAQAWERFRDTIEGVRDQFYSVSNAVDDIFYGIKNNDWVGAFAGLTRALDQVKQAFSAAGTTADKFAAIAGVANGVGQAIGGVAGAGISGAASGALAGFTVGGPIGAAIGGIIGGLGGLFGASKAKKKAKKQAAEQARQREAERAAQVAAANRELEIQLIELGGDAIKAEAERRKDFLATLDPTTRALQEQVFAAQDLAQAQSMLADLQHQLAAAVDEAGAAEAERLKLIEQLPEAYRPLAAAVQQVLDAKSALASAQQTEADVAAAGRDAIAAAGDDLEAAFDRQADILSQAADRFGRIADDIADVRADLARTAHGVRGANLGKARARVAGLLAAGDAESLAALPDAIREFSDAAQAQATSKADLNRNLAFARIAAAQGEAAARNQVSAYQAQLQALDVQRASYDALLGIQRGVALEIPAAIAGLTAAITANFDAQVAASRAVIAANDNLAAVIAAANAASASANLSLQPTPAPTAVEVATALAENAAFQQLVINTGGTFKILDDVTQGGTSLSTIAAA